MQIIDDIIKDISSLPVEDRARIVDALLRTLNAPDPEIDQEWLEESRRRLDDLRSGRIVPIPGNEVFAKAKLRFS